MHLRPELITFLDEHPDFRYFIRVNPIWYAKLSRDPALLQQLKNEVDDFYGRSLSKRIEKFGEQLSMINMLMDLAMMTGVNPSPAGETNP